jgi:hypothetical protein
VPPIVIVGAMSLGNGPFPGPRYSVWHPRTGQLSGTTESAVVDPAGVELMVVRVRQLRGERYVFPTHRHAMPVMSIVRRGRHPLKQHWDLRDLRRGDEMIGHVRRHVSLGSPMFTTPCQLIDPAGRPAAELVNRLVHDQNRKLLGATGIDLVVGGRHDGRPDGRWAIGWERVTVSGHFLDVDCGPVANIIDPRLLLCGFLIAVQKLPRAGNGDDRPNPSTGCSLGDLSD